MEASLARMGFMEVEFDSAFIYMKGLSRLKNNYLSLLVSHPLFFPHSTLNVRIKAQID